MLPPCQEDWRFLSPQRVHLSCGELQVILDRPNISCVNQNTTRSMYVVAMVSNNHNNRSNLTQPSTHLLGSVVLTIIQTLSALYQYRDTQYILRYMLPLSGRLLPSMSCSYIGHAFWLDETRFHFVALPVIDLWSKHLYCCLQFNLALIYIAIKTNVVRLNRTVFLSYGNTTCITCILGNWKYTGVCVRHQPKLLICIAHSGTE
ncbi:hypothetical protein F5Y03DRAFT_181301 [Xylaria venustula]|nr:hypothetical protein F5Y03DRAFT_181301 [Xylaria venustula]